MNLAASPVPIPTPAPELVLGLPVTLLPDPPTWCLIVLVVAAALRTLTPVLVSQVIRIRMSAKITDSEHALEVLRLETPRARQGSRTLRATRSPSDAPAPAGAPEPPGRSP
ncbi:hypothetical protein [Pseudonocardia alni]|uniref:hypothetical protein n=1 Tax=Pseudonocardia alni TaxID=33907 RepID=UPI00280BCB09|nr:hypothetical protein [Pseudonocardia alni]